MTEKPELDPEIARLGCTVHGELVADRRGRVIASTKDGKTSLHAPEYGYRPLFRVLANAEVK